MMVGQKYPARFWQWLLLTFVIIVVLGIIYGIFLKVSWYEERMPGYGRSVLVQTLHQLMVPTVLTYWFAVGFLLIGSPFLLRDLRVVALGAWIIGVVGFFSFFWIWIG